jgi:hypothetical protein
MNVCGCRNKDARYIAILEDEIWKLYEMTDNTTMRTSSVKMKVNFNEYDIWYSAELNKMGHDYLSLKKIFGL